MADQVREVTSKSWMDRLGGAIKGVVVGVALFIGAFPFLFWNEGRAVKTYKTLLEGAGSVVAVSADTVQPGNEGKLVHVSGKADTQSIVSDSRFGVSLVAIKLKRSVEMFQWKQSESRETRKKLGGGEETITTYSYSKGWANRLINSAEFKEPTGHQNPATMPFEEQSWTAEPVTLGAFTLSRSLVGRISNFMPLTVSPETLPAELRARAIPNEGGYYLPAKLPAATQPAAPAIPTATPTAVPAPVPAGATAAVTDPMAVEATPAAIQPVEPIAGTTVSAPAATVPAAAPVIAALSVPTMPEVGDVRVTFQAVHPGEISVIARQERNTFEPYQAKAGGTIEMLKMGTHSAETMFEQAQQENVTRTWILRFVGFLMMLIGLTMIFKPLSVVADVVPVIGSIVGAGTGLIALILAAALSLLTIAVAWIVYRPLLGILLLIVGVALIVGVPTLLKRGKAKAAQAAPPAIGG